jgi:anti-sigma B factor antagonist
MDINVRTIEQVTVVEISGELDGKTAPSAQERIVPLIGEEAKILLDMSQVSYMSSAGLRMMLLLYRQAAGKDSQIALVGLSEEIQDTMSATGFLDYFTTGDTVEAGLEALR